jgi:phenylalanyl-tRNA synthetase beta chain
VRIPRSWLEEFVDLTESTEDLRTILDDLGLVVEGIEHVGEGLEDVVVARIDEVRAIEGADRVRLVVIDAGNGPLEIVCGATNFDVGNHVPFAPVGAVLPGGFEIALRKMRGVTSNGMLCSSRELGLGDDHQGLMVLDALTKPRVGESLLESLGITPDVVFDVSVEGNRPDAWSIEGVARDLATRLGRTLRAPSLAVPNSAEQSSTFASALIDDPDLCGRLSVSVLRQVSVGPSPSWIVRRLRSAGMRPISNVVDASNLVMLELGQPTHPYDAQHVADHVVRVRRAVPGESLETLDGVTRELAKAGRGLGDTGEDLVIVDGDNHVMGLAGIMGGASSEISDSTSDVLLEAAFFDPMTIARSSKRHGLRSEASNRFERGVDPNLALRAAARFVEILSQSVPDLQWLAEPLDVWGTVPERATIELRAGDIERGLGVDLETSEVTSILEGLGFEVEARDGSLLVRPPSTRLDVRSGAAGRADVIEEIARLHSYHRLPRETPAWPEPGGLSQRQKLRRLVRDVAVDLGMHEAWTPTLGSDPDFDLLGEGQERVRITNPLASEESVLRATMLTGLVRAWGRNVERGTGDVVLGEIGMVFAHPDVTGEARTTKGGVGGSLTLRLPYENERLTILLGRGDDDATTSVALWAALCDRLGLADVVARSVAEAPAGFHPTRCAKLVDRATGTSFGFVGEVDPQLVTTLVPSVLNRRLGVLDVDMDILADWSRVARRSQFVAVPSRFPSAAIDLAFVAPSSLHAQDLAHALASTSQLVEEVTLFDVYRGANLPEATRSLAYGIRLSSPDQTLAVQEIGALREELIATATGLGAVLR